MGIPRHAVLDASLNAAESDINTLETEVSDLEGAAFGVIVQDVSGNGFIVEHNNNSMVILRTTTGNNVVYESDSEKAIADGTEVGQRLLIMVDTTVEGRFRMSVGVSVLDDAGTCMQGNWVAYTSDDRGTTVPGAYLELQWNGSLWIEVGRATSRKVSTISPAAVAFGDQTTASGKGSIATGYTTEAAGEYSSAAGDQTLASGDTSHAEGRKSEATEAYSHAEGHHACATGEASHAECHNTVASGEDSHAEGTATEANGNSSHAEGKYCHAEEEASHAEGIDSYAWLPCQTTLASGRKANVGDNQRAEVVLWATTTDDTETELLIGEAAGPRVQFAPMSDSTNAIEILLVAHRTDVLGEGMAYRCFCVVQKGTTDAAIEFIGTPAEETIPAEAPWTVTLGLDTVTEALKLTVTGEADKTILWSASVRVMMAHG